MTTAITLSTARDINEIQQVARLLAMSGYFDAKGNGEQAVAQLATKILAGRELGYGEFTSVQGIHVIQGKPALSANLMAAAVKASARYDYRVRQMDDTCVTLEFFERIGGKLESLGTSSFTADDAKKAGTQNMAKFARNMLFARAMSNGVRWYCPDVFFGNAVYTPEELGAPVDGEGNMIEGSYTVQPPVTEVTQPQTPAPTNGKPDHGSTPITDKTKRTLHALGNELYGPEWEAKRHALVRHVTGVFESSNDLTEAQAQTLIDGMRKRQRQLREQAGDNPFNGAPDPGAPMGIDMDNVPELAH